MKKIPFLFAMLFLIRSALFAQVGVNTDGSQPDPSAGLEVKFTNKGFLPPRMNTIQRDAIVSPATGLIIYNTECNDVQYFNGTGWVPLGNTNTAIAAGSIDGNANPCQYAVGVTYSVAPVSWIQGYYWTVPLDATITAGQGTETITLTFGASGGVVCVSAYGNCWRGLGSCLPIQLQPLPSTPIAGNHSPSATQIVWNWNAVQGATGYRFSSVNDFSTAQEMGTATTKTETGLICNTAYTRYVWAYNACASSPSTLTQTTLSCSWSVNDSVNIGWVMDDYDGITANNNHIFLLSSNRDSLYIYNAQTLAFIHKQYLPNGGHNHGRPAWKNNKLYVAGKDAKSIVVYDAANINNLTLLQNATFDMGWFIDQHEDQNYIFWVAHWNQKIQIIDVSTSPFVLKQYVGVNGNSGSTARNGNYLYVANQYTQSVRVDMTNPNSCIVTSFGNSQSDGTGVTNSGFVVQDHAAYITPNSNKNIKIYNYLSGAILDTKSNAAIEQDRGIVLPDNYCIIADYSDNKTKLYNINSGSFVFVKNLWSQVNIGKTTYNDQSIFMLYNNKIYKYNRGL